MKTGNLEAMRIIFNHPLMTTGEQFKFFKAAVSNKWAVIVQDLLDGGFCVPEGILDSVPDLEMLEMLMAAVPAGENAVEYLAGDDDSVAKVLLQKYMKLQKYEVTEDRRLSLLAEAENTKAAAQQVLVQAIMVQRSADKARPRAD